MKKFLLDTGFFFIYLLLIFCSEKLEKCQKLSYFLFLTVIFIKFEIFEEVYLNTG